MNLQDLKTVATHDGTFHADDVFSVAILRLTFPKIKVIRTRNPIKFNKADVRVDVGRKYNPRTGDFDHHQIEFKNRRPNKIPYASAGLVWKHFGMRLAGSEEAFNYIDRRLIQPIDANDSGVKVFKSANIEPYTIDKIVKVFYPNWQEKNPDYDKEFMEMVSIAVEILKREVDVSNSLKRAEKIMRKAIARSNGKFIVLDPPTPPWQNTVIKTTKAKIVVYKYSKNSWCAEAVPKIPGSFERRIFFPKKWAALEGKELIRVTGIKDAIFCHKNLFVALATSKMGAIELARKALK